MSDPKQKLEAYLRRIDEELIEVTQKLDSLKASITQTILHYPTTWQMSSFTARELETLIVRKELLEGMKEEATNKLCKL